MLTLHELAGKKRVKERGILDEVIYRWSPRSMTGESLTKEDLAPLFESARWAPSSYNNQPWRFHYATRDSARFQDLFGLLVEANKAWCKNAGCLIVLVSKTTFDHNGRPARTHAHDTGAAWHAFAIEALRRNLVAHGMQGFDYDAAARVLGLTEEYSVNCMIAVGRPAEGVEKENVSGRKAIEEIAVELK